MTTEAYPVWIGDAIFAALREMGAVEVQQAERQPRDANWQRYITYLRGRPGATAHDIASALTEQRTAVTQRLIRMEQKGLLRKESIRGHIARWWVV